MPTICSASLVKPFLNQCVFDNTERNLFFYYKIIGKHTNYRAHFEISAVFYCKYISLFSIFIILSQYLKIELSCVDIKIYLIDG